MLGPRKPAHMEIHRDDVVCLTNPEWNNISFEAFKITVLSVGSLTSQGQQIICSCAQIIFESSLTEVLGSTFPSQELQAKSWDLMGCLFCKTSENKDDFCINLKCRNYNKCDCTVSNKQKAIWFLVTSF